GLGPEPGLLDAQADRMGGPHLDQGPSQAGQPPRGRGSAVRARRGEHAAAGAGGHPRSEHRVLQLRALRLLGPVGAALRDLRQAAAHAVVLPVVRGAVGGEGGVAGGREQRGPAGQRQAADRRPSGPADHRPPARERAEIRLDEPPHGRRNSCGAPGRRRERHRLADGCDHGLREALRVAEVRPDLEPRVQEAACRRLLRAGDQGGAERGRPRWHLGEQRRHLEGAAGPAASPGAAAGRRGQRGRGPRRPLRAEPRGRRARPWPAPGDPRRRAVCRPGGAPVRSAPAAAEREGE
ncbi:unnamed protein product, partial [Prorocentrum cordatum]